MSRPIYDSPELRSPGDDEDERDRRERKEEERLERFEQREDEDEDGPCMGRLWRDL